MSRSPHAERNSVPSESSQTTGPVVKTVAQHSPSPKTNESEREHKQAGGADTPKSATSATSTAASADPPPQKEAAPQKETPGAHKNCEMQKTFAQLSDRQSSLKERLNVLSKRLFRYKTKELVRHIVNQLDKFDEHAIKNQVEPKQQLPCQHKFEDRPPSHTHPISHRAPSSEPPIDGHAFSTMEKLRVNVGEELLHQTSVMLSRYDDEKTDSSSDEDETTLDDVSEKSVDRTEITAIEQRWERERAQIAAQWTWIRGQYEDLQHRMRRESDLLSVYREKKEKVVLLPNDHYMKDHIPDKFAHHPAMVPPLNGYHNHPSLMMKNNFKFDMSRTGQEMYLKSNQHKRMNKTSKIDGNTCARTRPLACMVRRNLFHAKEHTRSIVQKNVPLRRSVLGKHCNKKTRTYPAEDQKHDSSYHPVLSRRSETHLNVHLTPLLSGVDFFPSANRKLHPPPEPRCETPKEKSKPVVEDSPQTKTVANDVKSSPQPAPVTPSTSTTNHTAPLTPCLAIITSESSSSNAAEPPTPLPKKRSIPGATVEHMIKKYRTSTSQPGSRASSPTHSDKRKKPNQFDIHNIEVDFSVVAPARIERPRYKEIEIPKFRIITEDMLNELAKCENQDEVEDDRHEMFERLHSRCERLEKVRFINMQINATGGMRGANTDLLSPALLLSDSDSFSSSISIPSPSNKSSLHPSSDKRTIALLEHSDKRATAQAERSRVPSAQRKNNGNNVTFLEEEIRRTRASKHTSDYPTAVS
ncbi:hypothetical protein ACHWQZ_G011815 [Mnemiopsis leidyi]